MLYLLIMKNQIAEDVVADSPHVKYFGSSVYSPLKTMPGKKVMNRNNKRNTRGRRGGGLAPVTQITSKRTVEFRYPVTLLLGEAAPRAGFVWTFRINSIFDPDFTSTGNQPVGFDQFAALYGRYTVLRAHFEVIFSNVTSLPGRVGYYLTPQSSYPSASDVWCVQPHGKSAVAGALGSGKDTVTLRGSTSMFKELGVTRSQYMDDQDFSSTTSANPLRPLYLHVYVQGISPAGNASIYAAVKLAQVAELSQMVNLTYS